MSGTLLAFLCAFATVATGIAVWAGPNVSVALPAAVVAVIAASLLFIEVGANRISSARLRRAAPSPSAVGTLRRAFTSGRLGREAIVDTLDRLERAGPNPNLPARQLEETGRILRMSEREFREYLRTRVDQLELRS